MTHSCPNHEWLFLLFFHGILLICMSSCLKSATIPTFANETDRLALLDFKSRITQDPLQIMSSWNDSIHFCNWLGVTCGPSSKRVMVLNLTAKVLSGSIPPSIGNLTYLTGISLQNNDFYGEIPQEVGHLQFLQHFDLSGNSFGGKLPTNLSYCTQLRVLNITYNNLIGPIPHHLNSLSKLVFLYLGVNNLTGNIPAWIGNFSSLYGLGLSRNNFHGSIPSELGRLPGLGFFQLSLNYLSGTIPPSIYNISSIYFFSVTQNQLLGSLPPDVGLTLPNLKIFFGGINNFTGPIPMSLSNASQLQELDFSQNGLTGTVPQNLASLQGLVGLNLEHNRLGKRKDGDLIFLNFLGNCTGLVKLALDDNYLGGVLPNSIANLSTQLKFLFMGRNVIWGGIPVGIGNLINLEALGLDSNYLGGTLPDAIGKLQKLNRLWVNNNKFYGPIPSSMGNLTTLTLLYMEGNRFEGRIPPSLGNCRNLLLLDLSSNNLSGTIPKQVIGISSLSISLVLSQNFLIGALPFEVGKLKQLSQLDLSENRLSGKIPTTIETCLSLEHLYLQDNSFQGEIPQSLGMIRGLEEIDLSRNNFSGHIPKFLSKYRLLKHLNISYNDFEGEVPSEGVFANASHISIIGNDKLCGGVQELHLPTCLKKYSHSSRRLLLIKIVIPISIFVIFLLYFFHSCSVGRNSREKELTTSFFEDWQLRISYAELLQSTAGFSENNLIGSGSFGSVYKGVLPRNGAIVAVKVLNLQQRGALNSFINECNALRSICHRNLLKIMSACSSIDHKGNAFKSLIFEFMCNGNLEQWLYPKNDVQHQSKRLSFIQRLNIAIDVASALEYLHHLCQTQIVHCDLKPSNILLDEDMVAHVGDFGLVNFLFEASNNLSKSQTLSVGLKGSIGYIPPGIVEYGMGGQVSTLGDIYSYGILLLEMFIGKRPIDEMFNDGLSIHKLTAMALSEHIMDIVDPSMFFEEDEENANDDIEESQIIKENRHVNVNSSIKECLILVFQIGLLCSKTSPNERIPANVVVNEMNAIRDKFLNLRRKIEETNKLASLDIYDVRAGHEL